MNGERIGTGVPVGRNQGAAFQISKSGANWLVEDKQGTQGRDTLFSVERAVFADHSLNLANIDLVGLAQTGVGFSLV
jgi:hypothetical protein